MVGLVVFIVLNACFYNHKPRVNIMRGLQIIDQMIFSLRAIGV